MHNTIIAQRYAKAVFELALEMNLLEEIKADMELISSVCADNKDFIRMLNSPVIRTDKKIKILKSVFEKEISDISMRYLVIITRKMREKFIRDIADEFLSIYKKFKNIFTVHFASAREISDEIRQKVVKLLEDQTKGNIELVEEVKEDLIGGFVMNYDDYKYDASIAYQLKKLRHNAAEINLYVKGI